jgi:transcription initiation factor TFIIE subunit alpha
VTKTEKKEYFCTFCQAEWTLMEVLDYDSPEGFLCHRCHHVLVREDNRNTGGHEQSTRLNDQFKFITELLPQIDAVHIPECDFDKALAKARPVVRDETHQRADTIAADMGVNRPMAVKGLTNTGPQSIAVNISTSDGPSEAEKEAERTRKEQIAKQNALPSWMSNSTVTGDSFSTGASASGLAAVKEQANGKANSQVKNEDNNAIAQIDDFFERLKAERAAAEKVKSESEESGSEEDEGEFEDVPATGVSSGHDTTSTPNIKQEPSRNSPGDVNSPDERQAKRVKIEPDIKVERQTGSTRDASDDDEEEELEFEDV